MKRQTHIASYLSIVGLAASVFDCRRNMIVSSPIFNTISGKLGGAVGMTSRFGMQLRGKVIPTNPQTQYQQAVRNILAYLASRYKDDLDSTERGSWENLADDTPGSASGLSLYVKGNAEALRGGGTAADTAPDSVSIGNTPQTGVILDVSDNQCRFNVTLADLWNIEGGGLNVYVSREQPASRRTRIHPFQLWGTKSATLVAAAQTLAKPANVSLVAGKVAYVKFVAFSGDGKVSTAFTIRVVIQA